MTTTQPFRPDRGAAIERLCEFIPRAGRSYASSRNFDFGPENRGNVSALSPYLKHRLFTERELLTAALRLHSEADAKKFVEEVFWRAYFKGWMEQHPSVWTAYRAGVNRQLDALASDERLHARCERATSGQTGIECFDAWSKELTETGYLHNHARMWFASIWVFTLQLPWELGADFFYRHLLDGDAASNTLSWRWVSGLHTPGKTYLARGSNIRDFTNNRFDPSGQLADAAPAVSESAVHPLQPLPQSERNPVGRPYGLLITEEDAFTEDVGLSAAPGAILAAVATQARSPAPVSMPVRQFALGAVADGLSRAEKHFRVRGSQAATNDWSTMLIQWAADHDLDTIVTAYAPVGPVAERIAKAKKELATRGIQLRQVRRDYDCVTWPYATRGYFKLKARIPEMIEKLRVRPDEAIARLAAG
ncbi:MAG: FAD-binding domain-containing protein [Woeseiaceae bacterium]